MMTEGREGRIIGNWEGVKLHCLCIIYSFRKWCPELQAIVTVTSLLRFAHVNIFQTQSCISKLYSSDTQHNYIRKYPFLFTKNLLLSGVDWDCQDCFGYVDVRTVRGTKQGMY
jgi:hypothetical protein